MSDVKRPDFDMINAKLREWEEDSAVDGFACVLIARKSQKKPWGGLSVAAHFHGLWSQRVMSRALKRASDLVFNEMEKQDRVLGRAQ